MKTDTHRTSLLWFMCVVACAAVLASANSGCEKQEPRVSYSRQNQNLEFQKGPNRSPTAKTLYSMARILAKQGKDSECEFVLVRIIREYPEFRMAYCELAELRLRQQQVDGAIQALSAGLRVFPTDSVLLNNLGMCWLLKKEHEKALASFRYAAAVSPDNRRYRSNMALSLGMMGRYDEALSLFMLVMSPADAHYNLSVICSARRDYPRSMKEYERAAALGLSKKTVDVSDVPD